MAWPCLILIAGPAGVGKTSTAARIAQHPDWEHVSEDDYWVTLQADRAGAPRTQEEERVVQAQATKRVVELVRGGKKNVVLEFILYKDPPEPVLNYQRAFGAEGIPLETRLLRATPDEILRRMAVRGRPDDADVPARRRSAEHQLRCLASLHIDPAWVIDMSGLSLDDVYVRYFREMVEGP